MTPPRASLAIVAVLFFVSGLTGLVYEVIWAKYFALLLGSTAHAQMGVLAVFMGGLAVGAALFGGVADRTTRPLALYGWLEIAIGLSAAAFALGFDLLTQGYWRALASYPPPSVASRLVQVLACVLTMGVPTVCMGGTLPVLARAFGLSRAGFGKGVALLYGLNSAGAATGAAAAGFVFVPRWGLDTPFLAAAAVNVLLGLWVIRLSRLRGRVTSPPSSEETTPARPAFVASVRGAGWVIPLAAGLTGAAAMIYEVAWIRLCSLVLGSSTYSFSIMLTAFIIGIATGSFVFRLIVPGRREPVRFFVRAALASAAVVLLCVPFYEQLPYWFGRLLYEVRARQGGFATYQLVSLVLWVLVMFPLTFSNGLIFPALAHAAAQVHRGVGRPVSYVLAANTLGTIAGTVACALYFLPLLGVERTFHLAAGLTLCTALAVLCADRRLSARSLTLRCSAALAAFLALVVGSPRWDLRLLVAGEFRRHAGFPPSISFSQYKNGFEAHLLYYRDGATGTISVEEAGMERILRANGKTEASLVGDRETQLLLGHLPGILVANAQRALLIGFGSGMTATAVARHPLAHIDVVEISPEMIEAAAYFRDWLGDVLADSRVALHVEDARTFLFRTPYQYDVIISEPSNPWVAGVSSLFSMEFFDQIRARLAPRGVLVQWFHTYETSNEVVRTLLRTVLRSFPHVHLFQSNFGDLLLIASLDALQLRAEALTSAYQRARSDLEPLGLRRAESVLALELAPAPRLRSLVGDGSVHRDRYPLLEYMAPKAFFSGDFADLFQSVATDDRDGYLLPAAQMPHEALVDWAAYTDRLDLLRQANSIRILQAWFARSPLSPDFRKAATQYLRAEPRRLRLIQALTSSRCPSAHPLADCARGLVEVLATGPYPPNARFVKEVETIVLEAAKHDPDPALLVKLASLYVHASDPDAALAFLERAQAELPNNDAFAGRTACVRGAAWEQLGNRTAALQSYQACVPADPEEAKQIEAARARLRASGS